jgi:hypothetical protein
MVRDSFRVLFGLLLPILNRLTNRFGSEVAAAHLVLRDASQRVGHLLLMSQMVALRRGGRLTPLSLKETDLHMPSSAADAVIQQCDAEAD